MAQNRTSDGWPTELSEFRPSDWPGDDDFEDCTPEQAAMWAEIFAFRRWGKARRRYAREHGNASVIALLREEAAWEWRRLSELDRNS